MLNLLLMTILFVYFQFQILNQVMIKNGKNVSHLEFKCIAEVKGFPVSLSLKMNWFHQIQIILESKVSTLNRLKSNLHESSLISLDSNKIILNRQCTQKKETIKIILATLPNDPALIYSFNDNLRTLVAAGKLGAEFALKIDFKVNQYPIRKVVNSISELYDCKTTAADINLFNCFQENNGITWMMQGSHFLNTFSDGYAIYDEVDDIPTVLKESEKITQVTIESASNPCFVEELHEQKNGPFTRFSMNNIDQIKSTPGSSTVKK